MAREISTIMALKRSLPFSFGMGQVELGRKGLFGCLENHQENDFGNFVENSCLISDWLVGMWGCVHMGEFRQV